jgi:hypothetical protein
MAKQMQKPSVMDAEIEQARLRRDEQLAMEPLATSVRYDRIGDTIVIEINNGAALTIPRRLMQGLTDATEEQLQSGKTRGHGTWIEFEDLDAQFTIMSLLMGVYGGKQWMAEHGRRGGMARSEAKGKAARENGRKGGRPRKRHEAA